MNHAENHFNRLSGLLFGGAVTGAPVWLQHAVANCQARYGAIRLTDQFKAAINAFDHTGPPKPFELFVVGEGKFGKSTLVNCLLGDELSRVRGLPETRCFLRYVVTDNPRNSVRMYVRREAGMHDWLKGKIGPGRAVKELWEIYEHEVAIADAKGILEEEFGRLDDGNYEPAVLEVERDVRRSPRSAFSREIRIVDTPGLDQLFPNELKQSTAGFSEETSAERYIHWLSTTPRGKHLEWQFRRCDAAVWCVISKRLGSAITAASLSYFSKYAKKIVMAITHIDVARNESERETLLRKAELKYSSLSSVIRPVNGQAAWQALSAGSRDGLDGTGFDDLVGALTQVCEIEGLKVRNLARYSGLRTTEKQFRSALSILKTDYQELISKTQADHQRVERSRKGDWGDIEAEVNRVWSEGRRSVHRRVDNIEYRVSREDVIGKLAFHEEGGRLSSVVMNALRNRVCQNIETQAQLTTPYKLPAFDADGARSGTVANISVQLRSPELVLNLPAINFRVGDWFDHAIDYFDEKIGGMFDILPGVESKSSDRRTKRREELQKHIRSAFEAAWKDHFRSVLGDARAEVERLYGALFQALEDVTRRVEDHAGGTLLDATSRVDKALDGIAVGPVFSAQMLLAMKGQVIKELPRPAMSDSRSGAIGESPTSATSPTSIDRSGSALAASPSRDGIGELKEGKRVRHRTLGLGTIQSVRGNYVEIRFDDTVDTLKKFQKQTVLDPKYFSAA